MNAPSTLPTLRPLPCALLLGLSLGLGSVGAHASGFQLIEQNASGMGNAYAGSAAIADNASTIFFNPAGLTHLPGLNVSAGVALIRPSFKFTDNGSTGPIAFGTPPLGANTGGDAGGSWSAVPNMYLSYQVHNDWFVGLGVGAPFGLVSEFDGDWLGRFQSRRFEIKSINVNPTVAYKASDRFSIGVGINWQRLEADYKRAVQPHPIPGNPDLFAHLKLKDDAWGWNIGLLYQVTDATRVGLSYRSRIKFKADGSLDIRNDGVAIPPNPLLPPGLPAGIVQGLPANATVELPDTAILSVVHDLTPRWTLLADVSWTGWSSVPSFDIYSNGALRDKLDLRWRDTWRVALGANYKLNDQWTLKGGIAYDQSPVDSAKYRPASLPDNNRKWLSLGVQYRFDDATTIDVGYSHLFISKTPIANATEPVTKGTIRGEFKSNANMFGVQFSRRF